MIDELLMEAELKMDAAVEHAQNEFTTIRTGRANPAVLNRIMVDYYGAPTPLQQLATFSVPEPRVLVVSPFDKGSIGEIEKALSSSSLGLNPNSDGTIIRLVFPQLTEDRRKELIRVVKGMAEEGRVAVRNIRRSTKEDLEALAGEISDDDIHRAEKQLQDATDRHTARVDDLLSNKEQELLEV